jgi:hypothetical protein
MFGTQFLLPKAYTNATVLPFFQGTMAILEAAFLFLNV